MNPFDLTGPAFLVVFAVVAFLGLMAAWWIRNSYREPDGQPREEPELHPYEVAHLAGGATLAVNAALTHLVERGNLKFDETGGWLRPSKALTAGAHPLEKALFGTALVEFKVNDAREAAADAVSDMRRRLEKLGLEMPADRAWRARVWSALVMLAVAAFGAIKVLVGLSRHRPVAFLVAGCVLCLVAAAVLLGRRMARTHRGDAYLEKLRQRHAALQAAGAKGPSMLHGQDLILAMGLFGMGLLATGPMSRLHQAMRAEGGSCGDGGGCGGGGCGGGSGCGGGGGGGCGGCGGGGGD